jgi:radical SAM protein with 4Fe4S-binding SPASM domain
MGTTLKDLIKQKVVGDRFATFYFALRQGLEGLLKQRRGSLDHLCSSLSWVRRANRIAGRPMNITIEPTNVCNLKCPVCETGAGILGRPKAFMSYDQFKIIIDKIAPHTNTLMFYYMGEAFLNKSAYDMIRYAKDQGIPFVTTCTNGDVIDPGRLVDSGIDEVSFQIGGITQETHQTYRVGSHLDKVLENLQETVRQRNARRPGMQINCGFILMKHNEHEIAGFMALMKQMQVDAALVVDPCVRTMDQAREFLPRDPSHWYYDPEAFEQGILKPKVVPENDCPWIYYSLAIQVNGDVVPCCRDATGNFVMGNLLRQDLDQIWNGEKFRKFRARLLQKQRSISICRLCSGHGVSVIQ